MREHLPLPEGVREKKISSFEDLLAGLVNMEQMRRMGMEWVM
ncbi:MAG: hypothetical protein QXH03_09495 [Candidatus Bathyarchaeia archaeon]